MNIYQKTLTMKLVRTEHEITIYSSASAKSIKEALANVPDTATVVELLDDELHDNIETIIVFRNDEEVTE